MASIKDVAKEAGVSVTTASRAIRNNGYVSDEKRKRIEAAIEKLAYRPNVVARSLASSQTHTVGVCVPFLNTPFFAGLVDGIESEAEKYGYDLLICHSKENVAMEKNALWRLRDRQVDGLIVIPVGTDAAQMDSLLAGIPTVITMRDLPDLQGYSTVCVDDYRGTVQVLEKLVKNGHRKIGFIKGQEQYSTMTRRWQAVNDLCREHGICVSPEYVEEGAFNAHAGQRAAKRLLDKNREMTAVFCLHHWACIGTVKECHRRGIRIPGEMSLATYETFEEWNLGLPDRITGNLYPAYEMGEEVFRVLMEQLRNPNVQRKQIVLDLKLNGGNSIKTME